MQDITQAEMIAELREMRTDAWTDDRQMQALDMAINIMRSIEDIKAEINEGIESYKNKDKAVMYGFMCALYIINKHIEGWDKV